MLEHFSFLEDKELFFNRKDKTTETAHMGTGLGLFISKSIVDLHGSRIEVFSKLAEGSIFTIHLPK